MRNWSSKEQQERRSLGRAPLVAHIWDGDDTRCRLYSTGGIRKKKKYRLSPSTEGRRVCEMCSSAPAPVKGRERLFGEPPVVRATKSLPESVRLRGLLVPFLDVLRGREGFLQGVIDPWQVAHHLRRLGFVEFSLPPGDARPPWSAVTWKLTDLGKKYDGGGA